MMVDKSVWYDNYNCVIDRLEIDIILSYIYYFMNMYRYILYFVFFFIFGLIYDDFNDVKYVDVLYLEFLKKL